MDKTVPKLDLAPKLNRPLYLWNPLDYLLLLYWVFFFPQALTWYENKYGGKSFRKLTTWQEKWQFLRQNPQQQQLWLQGILLTIVAPYIICSFLKYLGITIDWPGVAIGVAVGVALGVAHGVALGVAHGVAGGVALGVAYGVAGGVAGGVALGVAAYGVTLGVGLSVTEGVAYGVGFSLSILRLENWLLGVFSSCFLGKKRGILLSRITVLPLPSLTSLLKRWLSQDWETGIYNLNQLLQYSLQFIPVVAAINRVLAEIPSEQLIYRVSQLAENTNNWDLVKFSFVSLNNQILDLPPHAVAAGFWYLHEREPVKAKEAFAVVRSLLYGEEMYALADILSNFILVDGDRSKSPLKSGTSVTPDVSRIANIDIPNFPPEPYLRPTTWDTLKVLYRVREDVELIERGTNRLARSSALNRAIGKLQEIININTQTSNPKQVPKTERELIIDIAKTWQTALQNIAKDIGQIVITEPIPMPYVIGPPVEGQLFAGREDILRQLKQLWAGGQNLNSVVLYGHRRMGKTSILKNINQRLAGNVTLVYTNLQGLGDIQYGISEVLLAIGSDIARTLKIEPPKFENLLKFSEITFKNFLQDALDTIPHQGLIIALDEFEILEELIKKNKITDTFLGVFRTWTQLSPRLGFVFAGLHTLKEKVGDYDQPFFSSFIPKRVSFLDKSSTYYLLAEPNQDFPLTYTRETLDRIYELTYGQPFLVQLIGFQMVSRYNKLLQRPTPPQNTLTLEDLEVVLNDEFFQQGSYYFDGIWKQAAEGAAGQQEILKALAPHQDGLIQAELLKITQLTQKQLEEALKTLDNHDVIQQIDGRFKIVVELFRRWLLEKIL